MMKKTILSLMLLTSCGGGGLEESVAIHSSSQAPDYNGTYTLRDHDCTNNPIKKFVIVQTDKAQASFTVSDPGDNEALRKGDQFFAPVLTDKSISLTDNLLKIDCIGTFVQNEEVARAETQIDINQHDLITTCSDDSADKKCTTAYQHKL